MDDFNQRPPRGGRPYTGETRAQPIQHEKRTPRTPRKHASASSPSSDTTTPRQRPEIDRAAWHAKNRRTRQAAPSFSVLMRRIWLGIRLTLLAAVILLIVGLFLVHRNVQNVAEAIVVPDVRPNPSIATPLVGGMNVLIIGVDERPDHPEEGVRSDTLILAHIDAAGKWVNLLSIPRDTQVEIPEIGITKINVAYGHGYAYAETLYGPGTSPQQGGMALAAQTVEGFFSQAGRGVRVDYTAQVNFDGFIGVIDALGGVDIDVPKLIIDDAYPTPDFGTMVVEFQPGMHHMDGQTALIYARTRHWDNDFERSSRQQQVLRAIVDTLHAQSSAGRVTTLPGLLESLKGTESATPPVLTTLPIGRIDVMTGIALLASDLNSDSIGQLRISPDVVGVVEDGSNLIWDPAGVNYLAERLYIKPEEK